MPHTTCHMPRATNHMPCTTHHTPHSKGKVDKHLHGDLVFFDPFESNNKPRYFYRRPSGFEFFSSGDGRLPCLQLAEGVLDPLKQICGKSKDKKCKNEDN